MNANDQVGMSDLPAVLAQVITLDTDLVPRPRSLWIGGAGNVNVDMANGDTVLFSGATAGSILPISVRRVRSTSTTATLIVALY